MALSAQAQLLDELMGKNRNAGPGIRINSVRFDDEEVCKFSLCGFCPHDLFVNTRADLGPCDKIHDEELGLAYEKSSRFARLGYEDEFERFIRSLLMDVEKKIKRGVERLKLTQSDPNHKTPSMLRDEKIIFLKDQINFIIREAESLGELGEIDQAQAKLESCEKFKSECRYLEVQAEQNALLIDQKIMEVCEVCGSFLIVNDAQARVEEHIAGKQHMGYAKLRLALEDLRQKRAELFEKREKERMERRELENKSRADRNDREGENKSREGETKSREGENKSLEVEKKSREGENKSRSDRNDRDRDRNENRSDRRSDRDRDRYSDRDRDRYSSRRSDRGNGNSDSRVRSSKSPSKNSNSSPQKRSNGYERHTSSRRTRSRSKGDRKNEKRRGADRSRSRSRDHKRRNENSKENIEEKPSESSGNGEQKKEESNEPQSVEKVREEGELKNDSEMDEGEIKEN